jgi:spore maturation protein CgeB
VEPENNQTKLFFTPEEEYISYKTIDEAAEKIKYYLSNERERLQIVWRAAARIKHYNMNEWWKIVMDKIPTGIITMN